MMDVLFICKYCNHSWRKKVYSGASVNEICTVCKDKNIDAIELDKYRIDYYKDCPPFPEKEIKREDLEPMDFPYWSKGD